MLIDALSVLCAQLTRDLLAIAKFLFVAVTKKNLKECTVNAYRWSIAALKTSGNPLCYSFRNFRFEM